MVVGKFRRTLMNFKNVDYISFSIKEQEVEIEIVFSSKHEFYLGVRKDKGFIENKEKTKNDLQEYFANLMIKADDNEYRLYIDLEKEVKKILDK